MQQTSARDLLKNIKDTSDTHLITGVYTDSRSVCEDSIFVAIKGERVDGHDFAQKAIDLGARYIVAEHDIEGIDKEKLIIVESSLDAMITIGGNYRDMYSPKLIGITGSVGKTTTKEFVSTVLTSFGKTLKTQGNQNNELGVPNTVMGITKDTEYAVVEMGMDGLGDITKLSKAAKPCASVITCIGLSHLEKLGTRENILKAKLEICDGMEQGSILVLNGDDEYLKNAKLPSHIVPVFYGIDNENASVIAKMKPVQNESECFTIIDGDDVFEAQIPAIGKHNVYNALAAYTLATRIGLSKEKAVRALQNYHPTGMRQRLVVHNGVKVLEDCYNANPDSMRASINAVMALEGGKKIAVLGDMLELGEISKSAHREVGEYVAENGVDMLICVGDEGKEICDSAKAKGMKEVYWFASKDEAVKKLKDSTSYGDCFVVKASRGMKMEDILNGFYEN